MMNTAAAMYLHYFGFKRDPFRMSPEPDALFRAGSQEKAVEIICYGIRSRAGFMTVTGEEGLGKTTVLRTAVDRMGSDQLKVVALPRPDLDYEALLQLLSRETGLVFQDGEDRFQLLERLHAGLIDEYNKGNNLVLVVDDAQHMTVETLENLRMLSDFSMGKDRLLQIVLAGQHPQLSRLLNGFDLRQLNQRIAYRVTLSRLTPNESIDYINQLINDALTDHSTDPLKPAAVKAIAEHCKGVPRQLNILCRNVLVSGCAQRQKSIGAGLVRQVVSELEGRRWRVRKRWLLAPASALLLAALFFYFRSSEPTVPPQDVQEAATVSRKPGDALAPSTAHPASPKTPESFDSRIGPPAESPSRPGQAAIAVGQPDEHTPSDVATSTPDGTRAKGELSRGASHQMDGLSPDARTQAQSSSRLGGAQSDPTTFMAPPAAGLPLDPLPVPHPDRPLSGPEAVVKRAPALPAHSAGRSVSSDVEQPLKKGPDTTPALASPRSAGQAQGDTIGTSKGPSSASGSLSQKGSGETLATSDRHKPVKTRRKPDPSEIIDWFIDKRTGQR